MKGKLRQVLRSTLPVAAAFLCALSGTASAQTLREVSERSFPIERVAVGVAAHSQAYEQDVVLREIISQEFAVLVPANDFKQAVVHPRPDAPWDWSRADRWIERAQQNKQLVRIHGPVGPQVSNWMKDDGRTPAELLAMLNAWVPTLCKRYVSKPQVRWIDVVNETVDIRGDWAGPRPGISLADNVWLPIGMTGSGEQEIPTYIIRAFELANEHCGDLKLLINQHVITPPAVEKVKRLVKVLRQRGLRVDGIGWQAHVDIGWEKLPGRVGWLAELIEWAHANQLEFHITENNVYMAPRMARLDQKAQAMTFAVIMRTLLQHRDTGFIGWTLWHARDDQTDNKDRLGCLWDNSNSPKLAYFAIRELLGMPPSPNSRR